MLQGYEGGIFVWGDVFVWSDAIHGEQQYTAATHRQSLVHRYTLTCTSMHIHTCRHTLTCMNAHMHTHMYTQMSHTHIHTQVFDEKALDFQSKVIERGGLGDKTYLPECTCVYVCVCVCMWYYCVYVHVCVCGTTVCLVLLCHSTVIYTYRCSSVGCLTTSSPPPPPPPPPPPHTHTHTQQHIQVSYTPPPKSHSKLHA